MWSRVVQVSVLAFAIASCTTTPEPLPCFDGWTTQGDFSSKIIELPSDSLSLIQSAVGNDKKLGCVMQVEKNLMLVLFHDQSGDRFATSFMLDDGHMEIVEEEIIVSSHGR